MNLLIKRILLLTVSLTATPTLIAQAPKTTAPPAPPRSVFVLPASPRDGRDPFFPESSRPYEDVVATKHTLDSNAFTIKGMSFERGRAMVIINNHTFAVGDEGDVLTPSGHVHIRLIDIRDGIVTIEANGSIRELRTGAK